MSPPSLLTTRNVRDLNIIYLGVAPVAIGSAFGYLERVMESQRSLQHVSLGLRDESLDGFKVGLESFRTFANGAAVGPSFVFQQAWAAAKVRCIDTDFYHEIQGQDDVETGARICFVAGSVVTSWMVYTLARQTDTFAYMFMADDNDLRWPDWLGRLFGLTSMEC